MRPTFSYCTESAVCDHSAPSPPMESPTPYKCLHLAASQVLSPQPPLASSGAPLWTYLRMIRLSAERQRASVSPSGTRPVGSFIRQCNPHNSYQGVSAVRRTRLVWWKPSLASIKSDSLWRVLFIVSLYFHPNPTVGVPHRAHGTLVFLTLQSRKHTTTNSRNALSHIYPLPEA